MFGLDWLTAPVIGAGIGAIAGGSSSGGDKSQTTTLDPRMANFVYGADGKSGLLGDAQSIYSQQMKNGGLNDMQRQGMGMQYQYLTSPQYMQGAQSLYDTGAGLLSGGVAGNPFNRAQGQRPQQGMQSPGFQFSQTQANIPTYAPQAQAPAAPAAQQPGGLLGGAGSGNKSQGGSGGGMSNDGGQGISSDTTKAALTAMSLSDNPAVRALFPSIAALLGVGGYAMAGQQADAMGAAGNKLADSQPFSGYGIGTVSDVDGNVRTYSSPSTIAAADAATFGQGGGYGQTGRAFGGFGNGSFGEGNY